MEQEIIEQKKGELVQYFGEKIGLTRETLEEDFKNRLEVASKFPNPEEIALSMLRTYYKKQELSLQNTIAETGVFLGFDGVVDWAEIARRKGEKDKNGIPIYPANHPFLAGKPIPEHDFSRKIYVFSSEGKEVPQTLKTVTIRGNQALADYSEFLYKTVNFRAIKSDKSETVLYGARGTQFNVVSNDEIAAESLIRGSSLRNFAIENLKTLDAKTNDGAVPFCFIKGNAIDIIPTNGRNNLLRITDDSLDIESTGIQCWVPKEQTNFTAETQGLILFGSASKNKNRETTINVFSVWCPPEWRVKPEKIEDDEKDAMDEVW